MPAALQTTMQDSSFAPTRWTVVRQAADSQTASQNALSALSELFQILLETSLCVPADVRGSPTTMHRISRRDFLPI